MWKIHSYLWNAWPSIWLQILGVLKVWSFSDGFLKGWYPKNLCKPSMEHGGTWRRDCPYPYRWAAGTSRWRSPTPGPLRSLGGACSMLSSYSSETKGKLGLKLDPLAFHSNVSLKGAAVVPMSSDCLISELFAPNRSWKRPLPISRQPKLLIGSQWCYQNLFVRLTWVDLLESSYVKPICI